jgi:outer membrane protein TolC
VTAALLVFAAVLAARPAEPTSGLTIGQAVELALKSYPSIHVSQEEMNAAAAGIRLARTAYLPRIDISAQVNRATHNQVFGLLLPQSTIPSITGPALGTNGLGTVWGSAAGAAVNWEPFDFGARQAGVAAANAARSRQEAALQRTEFDVAVAAADAYVTLVAAEETVKAAQAGVDQAESLYKTTSALVNAELRPGADGSRAQAELAAAKTQLIQARASVDVSRANLARFVGLDPAQISLAAAHLLLLPPEQTLAPQNASAHPFALEQNATVNQLTAQLRILERSYFPRFYLQGVAFARGTGVESNGAALPGVNGLAPTTQNYGIGFTVTFPVSDLPALHAKEAEESASLRAERSRYQQIVTDLKARWSAALATLTGSRSVAQNTPVEVSAARAATDQATARYQAGLEGIDPVAEAQRLLSQAEIDDALARLSVWRGLLGVAAAAGDLRPFLAEASQ